MEINESYQTRHGMTGILERVCAFLINLLFHCCCYFQKVGGANGGKKNLIVKTGKGKMGIFKLSYLPVFGFLH